MSLRGVLFPSHSGCAVLFAFHVSTYERISRCDLGFLGSGKTTLLNRILNDPTHGMKFAVIENEFGAIGVDEKILPETVDEEVIEVMNGCICCTVRGDLVEALKRLHKRVDKFGKSS